MVETDEDLPGASDGQELRRARLDFGQLSELIGQGMWLLGPRARWLLALPVLSVGAAVAEAILLVSITQSLLMLIDGRTSFEFTLGPIDTSLGEQQLIWLAICGSTVSIGLRTAESLLVGRLAGSAVSGVRRRLIDSFFSADWRAMSQLRSGRLQQLLGNNTQIASTAIPMLATALGALVNLAIYAAFVVAMSPFIGLTFAVMGAIVMAAFSLLRRRTVKLAQRSKSLVREVQLTANSFSALNRELQLFNVQGAARDQLLGLNAEAAQTLGRLRVMQRLSPALFQQCVLLAVVLLVIVAEVVSLDPGSFSTAAILAMRSLTYLQQLNSATQSFVEAGPYVAELRQAVGQQRAQVRRCGTRPLAPVEHIELADVSFSYDGDRRALDGISLEVQAGDWVAIVGPSGGGKTTLAGVLAGLLAPTSGRFRVNGVEASDYSEETWASQFALLSQEPMLARGTIAENIVFYRERSMDAVVEACDRAAIADEVRNLPDAWRTHVGDGQAGLSGGQRQRLSLARALYGRPSVLILDEPTSALDALNASLIEKSLFQLPSDVIVIVISHRPTLLSRCNRFLVVQDGRIVRDGGTEQVQVEQFVGSVTEEH